MERNRRVRREDEKVKLKGSRQKERQWREHEVEKGVVRKGRK